MRSSVKDVLDWGRAQIEEDAVDWSGLCQSFCRQAYGVEPWATSAIHAWGAIPRAYKVTGRPVNLAPRGAILYYAGGNSGHAALAVGVATHDKCLSVDYQRQGRIDFAPRDFPRWGIRYLGYSFWTPYGELNR